MEGVKQIKTKQILICLISPQYWDKPTATCTGLKTGKSGVKCNV